MKYNLNKFLATFFILIVTSKYLFGVVVYDNYIYKNKNELKPQSKIEELNASKLKSENIPDRNPERFPSNNDDSIIRREEFEKRISNYENSVSKINSELTNSMIDKMNWQLTWFIVILSVAALLISGGLYALYKKIKKRYDKSFSKYKRKFEYIMDIGYDNFITQIQMSYILLDTMKNLSRNEKIIILDRMEISLAKLRVGFGKESDVIIGANILSQKGDKEKDIPVLKEALERKNLTSEARETIERAISEIRARK